MPGRRLFGGKSKRGPVESDKLVDGDGEILHEKIGTEGVSPKQVENLNRVLNTIDMSDEYLRCSSGAIWRSGTES